MTQLSEENRPKFKKPPVVEVSATAQFSNLDRKTLLIEIDKIWEKLGRTEYPKIDIKNRAGQLSHENKELQFSVVNSENDFECPRFWLTSVDASFVIQIQTDRLSVNWRQTEESTNPDYSSYEAVWERFSKALNIIAEFSKEYCESTLNINFMELAYINVIPFSEFGGAGGINKCIPSITSENIPEYLGTPDAVNFLWETSIDEGMSKFRIQGLTLNNQNTGENLLRLDYSQKGAVDLLFDNNGKEIHNWFNDAHLRIVNAFKDMSSEFMHKNIWRIIDEKPSKTI